MGRIKTQKIKSAGNEIIEKFASKFGTEFTKNKEAVSSVAGIHSKKIRNILAGYVTKKTKNNK